VKAGLIDGGWIIESPLDFDGIGELWNLPAKSLQQLRQATQSHLAGNAPESEVAAVDFFARVYLNDLTPWPDYILRVFDAWCLQETQNPFSMFAAAKISPAVTLQVLTQRYQYNPKSLGRCLTVAQSLPPDSCAEFFRMCSLNPDPDLRQYFFEVVSNFHRLVVPKSLTPFCAKEVMLEILHKSLQDPVAAVRERAIVYAYGMGWVDQIVHRIIELTRDESQDVRQYALANLAPTVTECSVQTSQCKRVLSRRICSSARMRLPETRARL
jgi:hypothetical protein